MKTDGSLPGRRSFLLSQGYRITGELGRGSFSVVYLAVQQGSGNNVALKMLHFPDGADLQKQEKILSRFRQEVAIASVPDHPYIVRLLDKGGQDIRNAFAAFEYEPGITLKTHIFRHKGLPVAEALLLMGQVLEALVHLHYAGIVHRDLKPQNIWVCETNDSLKAKIFDFSISSLRGCFPVPGAAGTFRYAAPEQLYGAEPLAASDLYSWALILLETLTGIPALKGVTVAGAHSLLPAVLATHPLGGLLRSILREDPAVRPAAADLIDRFRNIDSTDLPYKLTVPGMPQQPDDDEVTVTFIER